MFLRPPEGAEFLGSVAPAQVPSGGLTVPLQADFTQAQLGSSLRTKGRKAADTLCSQGRWDLISRDGNFLLPVQHTTPSFPYSKVAE